MLTFCKPYSYKHVALLRALILSKGAKRELPLTAFILHCGNYSHTIYALCQHNKCNI